MDAIFRRSSFYYVTAVVTFMGLMGRFMLTRDWPVFEVVPLFLPVWLLGALFASEYDECYAFLRTLPVPDATVVRTKFTLILSIVTIAWALMFAVSAYRLGDGMAGPSTFVYITLVCASGLFLVSCYQIAIWRYGFPVMSVVIGVSIAAGLVMAVVHVANLRYMRGWPAFSRLAFVDWLGGAPWISSTVAAALALVAFHRLMRFGIRIKAASEAHL